MTIDGLFSDSHAVEEAIIALKQAGIDGRRIEVYSSKPMEFEPGLLDQPSRMSFGAVVGGIVFGCGVTAFMFWAQRDYPLVTGGMPLNSFWGTGVITFEATMAGAILSTALMFLKESGVGRRKKAPALRGDEVVVRVVCDDGMRDAVERTLLANGVRTTEALA